MGDGQVDGGESSVSLNLLLVMVISIYTRSFIYKITLLIKLAKAHFKRL